ncbi:hypothetical protein ACH6EH_18660 [Paenibacillus sp. JSM ZJ436]|uniref:hypothetical protein n=1 Tax=Paenibacillus sp. JSM ZJ436 TaxID=3376190 RepID=UPI0037B22CA8
MRTVKEYNGFKYRKDEEYLYVYFEPTPHKKGYVHSFRLLPRPFSSIEEFIINGRVFECSDLQAFEIFDPEKSEHLERTGIGFTWPNNGLKKFFEVVNVDFDLDG